MEEKTHSEQSIGTRLTVRSAPVQWVQHTSHQGLASVQCPEFVMDKK